MKYTIFLGICFCLSFLGAQETNEEVNNRLKSKVTLDFENTPLEMVLRFFEDIAGITIKTEQKSAIEEIQITLQVSNVSLEFALQEIARKHQLKISVENGNIYLQSASHRESLFYVSYFDVAELVGLVGQQEKISVALLDYLIRENCFPDSWKKPAECWIEFYLGTLIIQQTTEGHQKIQACLQEYAALDEASIKAKLPETLQKYLQTFESQKVSINAKDLPFTEVINSFNQSCGLNIQIALEPDQLHEIDNIYFIANDVSLKAAINILCELRSLTYKFVPEGIAIVPRYSRDLTSYIEEIPSHFLTRKLEQERKKEKEGRRENKESKLIQQLQNTKLTLDFVETPLIECVDFLQNVTGIKMLVAPKLKAKELVITIQLREISLWNILQLLSYGFDLSITPKNNLLVFEEKTLSDKFTAQQLYRQSLFKEKTETLFQIQKKITSNLISLDLKETSLVDFFDFFQKTLDINVFLTPKVLKRKDLLTLTAQEEKAESILLQICLETNLKTQLAYDALIVETIE